MSTASRLKALERESEIKKRVRPLFSILWHDELVGCDCEPNCYIEPATGEHHRKVIRLNWGEGSGS